MANYLPNIDVSNGTQAGTQNTTQDSSGSSRNNTAQTGSQAGAQQQQNTYLPFQEQIQQGLGNNVNSFLTTGVAPNTQNVLDAENAAYNQAFQQGPAHQLAAQYGAGSPAIASALEQGYLQNTANVFANQGQAYNSALATAGNLALTPSGSQGTQTGKESQNTQSTQNWQQAMNEAQTMATNAFNFGIGQT